MKTLLLIILILTIPLQLNAYIDSYFSPDENNTMVVESLILSADTYVDVAAYSLTLPELAEALLHLHRRGVKVRVIMDKQQAGGKSSLDEFLVSNGVTVKIDKYSGLMHNKYIIVDGEALLTGSFNFTNNAVKNNRENFIITDDPETIEEFQNDFNTMWSEN